MDLLGHCETLTAAAREHAKSLRWLGYPEKVAEAAVIDAAADALPGQLKGAVEALRKIAEPTNGIRISAEMAQVVAKGALDSLKGR